MSEIGSPDDSLSKASNAGRLTDELNATNTEADKFVGAMKAWGVKGVFPIGLTVAGPLPGKVHPYPSFSFQDERLIPNVSGGILDNTVSPEVAEIYTFANNMAQGYRKVSQQDDFGSDIRELLGSSYIFILNSSNGLISKEDGIVSFIGFQNQATVNARYKCVPFQTSFKFDKPVLEEFSTFLESDTKNVEAFLTSVFPNFENEINRFNSKRQLVIKSDLPKNLTTRKDVIDFYFLNNSKKFLAENAKEIVLPTPTGRAAIV